jgi:hypothetical protein
MYFLTYCVASVRNKYVQTHFRKAMGPYALVCIPLRIVAFESGVNVYGTISDSHTPYALFYISFHTMLLESGTRVPGPISECPYSLCTILYFFAYCISEVWNKHFWNHSQTPLVLMYCSIFISILCHLSVE